MPKFLSVIGKEVFGFVYSIIFWWKLARYLMSGKCSLARLFFEWFIFFHVFSLSLGLYVNSLIKYLDYPLLELLLATIAIYFACIIVFVYPLVLPIALFKTIRADFKGELWTIFLSMLVLTSAVNYYMTALYILGASLFVDQFFSSFSSLLT